MHLVLPGRGERPSPEIRTARDVARVHDGPRRWRAAAVDSPQRHLYAPSHAAQRCPQGGSARLEDEPKLLDAAQAVSEAHWKDRRKLASERTHDGIVPAESR